MNKFLGKLILAAVFGTTITSHFAEAQVPPGSLLSQDGLPPFRVGMSLSEVNRLLKQPIIASDPSLRLTPSCDYAKVADIPGVAFVFIHGKLARIDVQTASIRSVQGLVIGDLQADVLRLLPNAKRRPLDHVSDGLSLVLEEDSAPNAMNFQLEGGRLTRIIAGNKRVILYSEGCD